ncbi:carboxypeptidase regulatory-like domain-containing protein [Streptomyces fuscichromogenes]|uniref:Uncharacterized protein n=1 Tax=Streptomyces fuscichromogenes TaxID=1324013 RepID=A0A917XDN5_9ACTN|nr:carboxypeptidase regulatory-like domain-containing protein [Streptomyces fuscichromogenes]GGN13767.1 hypothetical protein GCM10011578_041150 [Streptomyces fuscichromogenes]
MSSSRLPVNESLGGSVGKKITFTNTGQAPLHVNLGEQSTGYTSPDGTSTTTSDSSAGAPTVRVKGNYSPGPLSYGPSGAKSTSNDPPPTTSASTGPWTGIADYPEPVMDNAVGTYQGKVYSVAGVSGIIGGKFLTSSYVHDPATDTWTPIADIPEALESPGGAFINGTMYVAGGWSADGARATLYAYHPAADTWTRAADMPDTRWGATASGNDGKLQVVGGIVGTDAANTVVAYDPVSDIWSSLPNAGSAVFRAGGGCGIYRIGGMTSDNDTASSAEVLPGRDQCDGDDVSWLSADRTSFDLAPGRSTTVTVRADASAVATAGTYTARLTYNTDAPYDGASVEVSLKATNPRSWGHLSGTVTDRHTGAPLVGATVLVCPVTHAATTGCGQHAHTVRTDSDGHYDLWLDARPSPVRITASAAGHRPAIKEVTLPPGRATTADLALAAT